MPPATRGRDLPTQFFSGSLLVLFVLFATTQSCLIPAVWTKTCFRMRPKKLPGNDHVCILCCFRHHCFVHSAWLISDSLVSCQDRLHVRIYAFSERRSLCPIMALRANMTHRTGSPLATASHLPFQLLLFRQTSKRLAAWCWAGLKIKSTEWNRRVVWNL